MVVTQNSMREHLGESILLVSKNRMMVFCELWSIRKFVEFKISFVKLKELMFKLWQGSKKKLNSSLSFGQAALTFFLLRATICLS